ncbi:MAG: nicotinate-nucleotide adenylyltransferase [Bacteroidales bacterium]|nr:nicotinate-nucleotide adenylyltransferase [Bacteroidales bacterium]
MKIGLFFGSFNPIHIGHLALANYFVEYSDIDKLWFVVSPQNPFKERKTLLADNQRLYMVRLAIENMPEKYFASNIEFEMPKPSYTIDTLTYLKEKYPDKEFILIMGADNLVNLHKWKNYEEIIKNHKIYVYPRPEADLSQIKTEADFKIFDAPLIEISSSFIRNSINNSKDVRFFMPEGVAKYVEEMNFYK